MSRNPQLLSRDEAHRDLRCQGWLISARRRRHLFRCPFSELRRSCSQSLSERRPCAPSQAAFARRWHGKRQFDLRSVRAATSPGGTGKRVLTDEDDPGSWLYTREWAVGGDWGPGSGAQVAFFETSAHGNEEVVVTAHHSTYQDQVELRRLTQQHFTDTQQQWRVLRFQGAGSASEQSVARTTVAFDAAGRSVCRMQADCLTFQYTKTIASIVAALVGLQPGLQSLLPRTWSNAGSQKPQRRCRALVIGLGAGSLPLFLSHAFPALSLDVVEIDPVVIRAASTAMGFPLDRPGLAVHEGDAVAFLAAAVQTGAYYDLVLLDAYNGANDVPEVMISSGSPFLADLAAVLHPHHGTFVMNLHGGLLPSPLVQLAQAATGDPLSGAGFDVSTRTGANVLRVSTLYRDALLGSRCPGSAFVVKALRQQNCTLAISRSLTLPTSRNEMKYAMGQAAEMVAQEAGYRFAAGDRARHCLWPVCI